MVSNTSAVANVLLVLFADVVVANFAADADEVVYEFGITSLETKKEFLQRGDQVQFQIEKAADGAERATRIRVVRKKLRSTVDAIKGQFGFLSYEVDDGKFFHSLFGHFPIIIPSNFSILIFFAVCTGKKLFFHLSEVKDSATLQPGDNVEFVLITNQRTGKSSACNVARL